MRSNFLESEWPASAIFGLVFVRWPNDRTEVTLPDSETNCRSRPGPKLPFDAVALNFQFTSALDQSKHWKVERSAVLLLKWRT